MKNLSIIVKILLIMACFGVFAIASALYAGAKIKQVDVAYSDLLMHEARAAQYLAKSNRALQTGRATIGDILALTDEKAIAAAKAELNAARNDFMTFSNEAIAGAPADASLKDLQQKGVQILDKGCAESIRLGSTTVTDADVISALKVFSEQCQPLFGPLSQAIAAKTKDLEAIADSASSDLTDMSNSTALITLVGMIVGIAVLMGGAYLGIRTWIVSPIDGLRNIMAKLASGNLDVTVDGIERHDEIGKMAVAVQVFKDNGLKARELQSQSDQLRSDAERNRASNQKRMEEEAEQLRFATTTLGDGLQRLASGDISFQLSEQFAADYEPLRQNFNASLQQLAQTIGAVLGTVASIDGGTREISDGANDLSKRTEQQAASLEETAAALDEITVNVRNSSQRTEEARSVAVLANQNAAKSAEVVSQAVDAMKRIEESSQQISNIIGVIDEIAFQTNLLALNAGVEAARAGEAGKGFAVVAQEVRELAQRSAQAAKEIKALITASGTQVSSGVSLVGQTGTALQAIGDYVVQINGLMDAIAVSAREQSTGLAEVNTAVNQMDQTTQQNAAMVEQSTAASAALASEAVRLRELVGQFRLPNAQAAASSHQGHRGASHATHASAPQPPRRPVPVSRGNTALKTQEWSEF